MCSLVIVVQHGQGERELQCLRARLTAALLLLAYLQVQC